MASQRQYCLTLLFILITSLVSCCFSSYQDEPSVSNGFHIHEDSYNPNSETNDRILRRLAQANVPATSPEIVNVDDFGAKADGTDDSQVLLVIHIMWLICLI